MKTATITWVTHNNYGTLLQAYALQQCLFQMGFQNRIISDENIISTINQRLEETEIQLHNSSGGNEGCLKKNVRRITKYAFHPVTLIKSIKEYSADQKALYERNRFQNYQYLFDTFRREHLDIAYGVKRESLQSLNEQFDAFLCGSDQIWSVLEQNFDGYFYLDFARKKKISYATSIGTDQFDDQKSKQIQRWLRDFTAISVRERQTADQLSALTGKDVEWVSDPTLLHDKVFWSEFCNDVQLSNENYMLCYFLSDQPWYYEYMLTTAKRLHLKPLIIPSKASQLHRKESIRQSIGPKEFVSLIQNAQYVLTDSYHGSIFSMQFEKEFVYLKRFKDTDPNCQNIRVISLFEKAQLMDRILDETQLAVADIKPIDYEKVRKELGDFRNTSRKFLWDSLLSV